MADEPEFTEFEQGERKALLEVRSFIAHHGTKEVSDFCATRLHDMRMDALHRGAPEIVVTIPEYTPPKWAITFDMEDGTTQRVEAPWTEGIAPPPGAERIAAIDPPTVATIGSLNIGTKR